MSADGPRGTRTVRQRGIDWTFFHRPMTLGKVSETTSGETNFSSRFSRIILKNFPPKVFRRLGRAFHVASREAALKGETAAFGPASKSIWILAISLNLYAP